MPSGPGPEIPPSNRMCIYFLHIPIYLLSRYVSTYTTPIYINNNVIRQLNSLVAMHEMTQHRKKFPNTVRMGDKL